MRENLDVEFKELDRKTGKLPDSIPKEIVAFANTEGGDLYLGVDCPILSMTRFFPTSCRFFRSAP